MRRVGPLLVVGLCVVVAGGAYVLALGSHGDCPPALHVTDDNGTSGQTVDYAALTETQQTKFRTARSEGYVEIPDSYAVWRNISTVRYRGDAYETVTVVC